VPYDLRFTLRALRDLGVREGVAPGDLDDVRKATRQKDVVDKFKELRRSSPNGTESPMYNVGRHDIYALHDRDGARACTWYDEEAEVCWFLGYCTQHKYEVLEARAINGELLPSLEDLTILEEEKRNHTTLLEPGIKKLVADAWRTPGDPQRGLVGGLLRLEVSIVVMPVDNDTEIGDLFLTLKLPPVNKGKPTPNDWPGSRLLERLVEMATNQDFEDLDVHVPSKVPASGSMQRQIDPSKEVAIEVRSLSHNPDGTDDRHL
jgi:hypothetical protein